MERIELTPELVVQCFKETGLRPVSDFGDGVTCGCGITAVMKKFKPESMDYIPKGNCAAMCDEFDELTGLDSDLFIVGFDGFTSTDIAFCDNSDVEGKDMGAFRIGKQARLAILDMGMGDGL